MKTIRKICSLILATLVLLNLFPASVLALEGETDGTANLPLSYETENIVEAEKAAEPEETPMLGNALKSEKTEEGSGEFVLSVNPYGNELDSPDTITWFPQDSSYYLFLPSDCDTSALTVFFQSESEVSVNGTILVSGKTTSVFTGGGGSFTLKNGEDEYLVEVMCSENIPTVFITLSGTLEYLNADKHNKESGSIRIYDNGVLSLDSALKQIKGRGNSTWELPKKPYNIKFDKKTAVLGMEKSKKWTLLASYIDPSFIRNPLAWYHSELMGLHFTSDYRIVDLYINGEYHGVYILCESVEIGSNRVDINDLAGDTEDLNDMDLEEYSAGGTGPDNTVLPSSVYPSMKWKNIPNDPADITGGYLLELEMNVRYDEEISGFVTSRAQSVVIKEPECASEAQVRYISGFWQEAEDAICSPSGYNALGKHYSEYFDMESLVNMYVLSEFSNNLDAGLSSTYFYKDLGGKLVASPVWDFDHAYGDPSCGKRNGIYIKDPSVWYVSNMTYNTLSYYKDNDLCPVLFNSLSKQEDFRTLAAKRWREIYWEMGGTEANDFVYGLADTIQASAIMNGIRWNQLSTPEEFSAAVDVTAKFISERMQWLNKGFGENAVYLFYDVNGGSGYMYEEHICVKGDAVSVKDQSFSSAYRCAKIHAPSEEYEFAGWNTKPNGKGTSYMPGDSIKLNKTTTLYAQWKPIDKPDDDSSGTIIEKLIETAINNPISQLLIKITNFITGYFKKILPWI